MRTARFNGHLGGGGVRHLGPGGSVSGSGEVVCLWVGRGCLPLGLGVSASGSVGCLPLGLRGVCFWVWGCLPLGLGVSASQSWGCLPLGPRVVNTYSPDRHPPWADTPAHCMLGYIPHAWWDTQPPPHGQNSWHTLLKALPSHN